MIDTTLNDVTQAERTTAIANGCTPKRDDADLVLDPIGGSGTFFLLALGRLAIEVSPRELFARGRREEWSAWGNEVESDIALDVPPLTEERSQCQTS